MKYLRVFNNDAEYQQFKGGGDYITPNVCLNRETKGIKCEAYIPPPPPVQTSNEIWYTSSDGNIVTPYYEDVFGANIVSNVYENGKGIITFDGPVTSIAGEAFLNCTSLTSITIPNNVTYIGGSAFYECTSLTSITIPDSVTSIIDTAFAGCSSLTSVTIPNNVTYIENNTFNGCTSLTSITIPNSVTSIGGGAFRDCTSLTSITIPDSVTSIGIMAFLGCTLLTSIYCKPTTPPSINSETFFNNASNRIFYVPTASVDAYKSAYVWARYTSYIVGYDF